jgi:hypothetical protein
MHVRAFNQSDPVTSIADLRSHFEYDQQHDQGELRTQECYFCVAVSLTAKGLVRFIHDRKKKAVEENSIHCVDLPCRGHDPWGNEKK